MDYQELKLLEDDLWEAADQLRTNSKLTASEYSMPVLDDWGKFRTMFKMYVADEEGTTHEPGSVKIGEVGMQARGGGAPLEPGFERGHVQISVFGQFGQVYPQGFAHLGHPAFFGERAGQRRPDRCVVDGLPAAPDARWLQRGRRG